MVTNVLPLVRRLGWRCLILPPPLKVTVALTRMEQGNFSNTKGVGAGVSEYKIDFGAGCRIYFGRDGDHVVIVIGGGTKRPRNRRLGNALNP